jgi:hypothetical protein
MWPEESLSALERQYAALQRALEALPATGTTTQHIHGQLPDLRGDHQHVSLERLLNLEKENANLKEELAKVQDFRERDKDAELDTEAGSDDKEDPKDEDMASDPFQAVGIPGAYVADFRLNQYPPGASPKSASPCANAVLEHEKDESSFLFLPQGTYLSCEFGTSLGKIEGPVNSYTICMDVKIELSSTDDANLSLFSLGWPLPKTESDIIITPDGIVRPPLHEFQAGDLAPKVPSKWCRICVTVSDQEKKIATYIDGVPVGAVTHPLVSATSGRFSMSPHGLLAFAATDEKMSSPRVRLRRIEVHKKAWSAAKVKETARKHWTLSEEIRSMTCLSATQKLQRLTLHGVVSGTRTVPIWKHAAFFGIFADRYVVNGAH